MKTKLAGSAVLLAAVVAGAALALAAPAAAERLIPFQGRVTDGAGEPLDGVYRVTFAIYAGATGGEALWVESHPEVSIMAGQVNAYLGSRVSLDDPDDNGNPSDSVSFADALAARFLGIKVGEDTNEEMVPRHELVPSFHARVADAVVDGGVTTPMLADDAVTAAKIKASNVQRPALNQDLQQALVPRNTVILYNGTACPAGWSEYTQARGRALVGLMPGGTLGGANSAPAYGNRENRTHGHSLLSGAITGTSASDTHNHAWTVFTSGKQIQTFTSGGGVYPIFNHGDGSDTAGAGFYPWTFGEGNKGQTYYTNNDGHSHTAGSLQLSNRSTNGASSIVPTLQLLTCLKTSD